jgi:hypothetical protein
MSGPDKIFGSGKRNAENVSSDQRVLPASDQRAYRVTEPGRPEKAKKVKAEQRKLSRASGIRDPEPRNGEG